MNHASQVIANKNNNDNNYMTVAFHCLYKLLVATGTITSTSSIYIRICGNHRRAWCLVMVDVLCLCWICDFAPDQK
jgi:hypothetical protein